MNCSTTVQDSDYLKPIAKIFGILDVLWYVTTIVINALRQLNVISEDNSAWQMMCFVESTGGFTSTPIYVAGVGMYFKEIDATGFIPDYNIRVSSYIMLIFSLINLIRIPMSLICKHYHLSYYIFVIVSILLANLIVNLIVLIQGFIGRPIKINVTNPEILKNWFNYWTKHSLPIYIVIGIERLFNKQYKILYDAFISI